MPFDERAPAGLTVAARRGGRGQPCEEPFLANTSHELRTPLNAIIGYAEMLIEEAEEVGAAALVPHLVKVRDSGRHLLALINDVSDLSRIEAGQGEVAEDPVDLDLLVHEAARGAGRVAEQKRTRLTTRADASLGWVSSDASKLRQILDSLLTNAPGFTTDGTIDLEIAVEVDDSGAACLRCTVADSGIGMTPRRLQRLFEPFIERLGKEPSFGGIPVMVLTVRDVTEEDGARLRGRVVRVLRKRGLPGENLLTEVRRVLDASARGTPAPDQPAIAGQEDSSL